MTTANFYHGKTQNVVKFIYIKVDSTRFYLHFSTTCDVSVSQNFVGQLWLIHKLEIFLCDGYNCSVASNSKVKYFCDLFPQLSILVKANLL